MPVPQNGQTHSNTPLDKCFYEKNCGGSNPPQRWPWKEHATTAVAAVIILEVANNWRSVLQINILINNVQDKYSSQRIC